MKTRTLVLILLLGGTVAGFTLEIGRACFTKQTSTPILSEPSRYGSPLFSVEWGKLMSVTNIQGRWVQVQVDNRKGWVYAGNLTNQKPPAENKNDFLPTTAADTTAAVAARPLSESSLKYAERKSLGEAAADIVWMEKQAEAVTREKLDEYMQEKKLGDHEQ